MPTLLLFAPDIRPHAWYMSLCPLFAYLLPISFPTPIGQRVFPVALIQVESPEQSKNTCAAADFLKGKYNTVGAAASAENVRRGQVANLIKEWEKHGVGAGLS